MKLRILKSAIFSCTFLSCSTFASGYLLGNQLFQASGPYFHYSYLEHNQYAGACIGGANCGVNTSITIQYDQKVYLQKVSVYAHDFIGEKSKAHLQVWADGVLIGEQDVLRSGSELNFTVNTYVSNNITLKSVKEDHSPTGDETAVIRITTY